MLRTLVLVFLLSACSAIPSREPSSTKPALALTRVGPGDYLISAEGLEPQSLRFLSPTSFHLKPQKSVLPASLPELMVLKTAFPAVDTHEVTEDGDLRFSTGALELRMHAEDSGRLLLTATRGASVLVQAFEIDAIHRRAVLSLSDSEHLYGFGDKRAALDQRGQTLLLVNKDAFASETNDSYKNVPFYTSSAGYGLFLHNFFPTAVDAGSVAHDRLTLDPAGGDLDFYFFAGTARESLAQYTELTGHAAFLPRWFYGFHQSRASYSGREGYDVAKIMREKQLPVDAIYYDDWDDNAATKKGVDEFWNKYKIHLTMGANPFVIGTGEQMDDMTHKHFTLVDAAGKPVIEFADEIADDNGKGDVTAYVDFFNPAAVAEYHKAELAPAYKAGVVLGMADFGEMDHLLDPTHRHWPSVPSIPVSQLRNYYGLAYTSAMVAAYAKISGGRPAGMVRPGTAGSQRLGWTTSGDSMPSYQNFRHHLLALLNASLTGFSNVGYDIGGWDSKSADTLYARWFAAGTFNPFMWAHGQKEHEPYVHGQAVEDAARALLRIRYKLIPYLYSLSEEASRTGTPMMRPWPLQVPNDPRASTIQDEYFLGEGMLVAPLFNDEGTRSVALPAGSWHDFFDDRAEAVAGGDSMAVSGIPLNRLPVYVRSGTVIPMGPAMQYSAEKAVDPLTVHYYAYDSGTGSGEYSLYEDDGTSLAYKKGAYQRTLLRVAQGSSAVSFSAKVESGDGQYRAQAKRGYLLHVHGAPGAFHRAFVNGLEIPHAKGAQRPQDHASWGQEGRTLWLFVPAVSARTLGARFE